MVGGVVGPPWGWSGRQMVRLLEDRHKCTEMQTYADLEKIRSWTGSGGQELSPLRTLILRKVLVPFKTH